MNLLTEIFLLLTALNQMIKDSVSSPFSYKIHTLMKFY
jgi:hypothetical protein